MTLLYGQSLLVIACIGVLLAFGVAVLRMLVSWVDDLLEGSQLFLVCAVSDVVFVAAVIVLGTSMFAIPTAISGLGLETQESLRTLGLVGAILISGPAFYSSYKVAQLVRAEVGRLL
jgi:hypothetical protein